MHVRNSLVHFKPVAACAQCVQHTLRWKRWSYIRRLSPYRRRQTADRRHALRTGGYVAEKAEARRSTRICRCSTHLCRCSARHRRRPGDWAASVQGRITGPCPRIGKSHAIARAVFILLAHIDEPCDLCPVHYPLPPSTPFRSNPYEESIVAFDLHGRMRARNFCVRPACERAGKRLLRVHHHGKHEHPARLLPHCGNDKLG